ncbi:MAG: PEP-CTERM sorting domain-containing protein [Myxococcota bacterium]|nr:PEP-CTERM sorting domain-containing protein [Myxococcota bacterium]
MTVSIRRFAPLALGLLLAPASYATTHNEIGDAGESFAGAQDTIGLGSLNLILGTLEDPGDVDLYRVVVEDLAAFSVTVTAQMEGPQANNDLILYVFDDNGIFQFEDLDSGDGLLPALPLGALAGEFLGNPLLVGITANRNTPAQRFSPISSWFRDPLPPQSGPYQLALTGAQFSQVPEPGAALLVMAGLAGLAARGRREA